MGNLLSTMDHKVSQGCRIYQLEDVCAHPGESPDELVDCLCTLADRCNFPSEEEKECNVQYRFVTALDDKELVKKLLSLDLKTTTAKMLEVCHTHITISDNLDAQEETSRGIKANCKPAPMWQLHKVTSIGMCILSSQRCNLQQMW